jgi:dTDP-4-amino-4,6-dideoxygalactose transaminase
VIEISAVELGEDVERRVLAVLRSGQLAQGPVVAEFEGAFALVSGVSHAVAVSSGSTALVAALQALGIGAGDEVITSPFSFVATLNAILQAGATARFADIDPTTFTIDPRAVEAAVTSRTAAIMPVHLYGQPAEMDALRAIADRHDLALLEDAAQAHGATFAGQPVGSFGTGCFSFYATKAVTTGEGGMVTTNDDGVAHRLRLLRNQGMDRRYEYELIGHNYRMTELQAAIGVAELARTRERTDRRRANAALLTAGLAAVDGLALPVAAAGRAHAFHQYTVRVGSDAALSRHELAQRLRERGVATAIYYPKLMHDHDCYRSHPRVGDDEVLEARTAAREVLSLPVHAGLAPGDLDQIIEVTVEALRG